MTLNALTLKSITCPEDKKQIKKSDGNGLFLLVKASGSKLWRMRFKYAGKAQEMAFGKYPMVSLKDARELTIKAQLLLAQGINPMSERKERKRAVTSDETTFGKIAIKWFENQKNNSWSADYRARVKKRITEDAKEISEIPIDHVDAGHITKLMLSIEAAGGAYKAGPILSIINRIFAYALAHGHTRINPAQGISLKDILKPLPKTKNRSAITKPKELAQLINDIDMNLSGSFCVIEALKLIPRIFLRPKEIRYLKWEYIDFDKQLITIPDAEMKKGREHLVPISKQVIAQLQHIKTMTGYSTFVFPGERDSSNPISKNVLTNRLRALGYSADVMSAHGFRSTASTILHEQGWPHEVIEVQLAHLIGTATSRAYDRSIHLAKRTKMMQAWSDQLDALRDGADVVPIGELRYG